MATDATGTPTSLGIPTYNPNADAPSGLGFNAAMDAIDALIAGRVESPASIASGEVPVWNGTDWVRSSVTNIGPSSLGSGTPSSSKFLRGDGAWSSPGSGTPDGTKFLRDDLTWAASGGLAVIFDVQVARGNSGDPATGATIIDSNTILGGNLPSTYKHLQFVHSVRGSAAAGNDNLFLRYNNDSSAAYGHLWTYGQNATAASISSAFAATQGFCGYTAGNTLTAGRFGTGTGLISDYNSSVKHQVVKYDFGVMDNTAPATISGQGSGIWNNTAAITRLQFTLNGNVFQDGSRITLYGMP
jgi:hypothetical protein